jgi:hypothetical protein
MNLESGSSEIGFSGTRFPYISVFACENSHELCTGTCCKAEITRKLPEKCEPIRMRALEGGRDDLRRVCVRGYDRMCAIHSPGRSRWRRVFAWAVLRVDRDGTNAGY